MRRGWVVAAAVVVAAGPAAAEPLRFRFAPGQVLTYEAKHVTRVAETTPDDAGNPTTTGTVTRLTTTKRWEVKAVDAAGATLELTVTAVRQEIARPGPRDKDGNPTVDRTILDSATTEGREQFAGVLGKPVLLVKLDAQGRVLEATGPSADRLAAEPPLRLVLPDAEPAVGSVWERPFVATVAPPLGTGEKYDAAHTFTLKAMKDGVAVVGLSTALKSPPKDPAELPPLVPLLWEGEIDFHPQTGRYLGARLTVQRDVANHQGEGSKLSYRGEYTETLVEK